MSTKNGGPGEPDVDARLRLALERVEHRLSAEDISLVRARLVRLDSVLERLREAPLVNADEPAVGYDPTPLNRNETRTS